MPWKGKNLLSRSIYTLIANAWESLLFSTSLNILEGPGPKNKRRETKRKKEQKRWQVCDMQMEKSLGRLQDRHLNCRILAGNWRLIKYWTRLDGCRGSIIIMIRRLNLWTWREEDSPWESQLQRKCQPVPQKRHLENSHWLLIFTSCHT